MTKPEPQLTHTQRMIKKATGAPDRALPALELIMRNEVFHSTLDWQSWDEFHDGARAACSLYARNPRPYDAEIAHNRAVFERLQAEHAVTAAEQQSAEKDHLKAVRGVLYRARRKETKARERLFVCLDDADSPRSDALDSNGVSR